MGTKFNRDNPLELLFSGPLDGTDLASLGVELMPESNYWEMLEHLNYLHSQYMQDPQKILTPHWWKESPEQFRDEMNEKLSRWLSQTDLTEEYKQRIALEIMLDMWSKFLFG